MSSLTPKERAQRAAKTMWQTDDASNWFGMEIVDVGEGQATVSFKVQSHHCNGFGICHGGVTFALADSTFAFACNSRNRRNVAQHNTITYLAPGKLGDTLTAVAKEVSLTGRNGIYDVKVMNSDHHVIAEFRGHSRQVDGQVFEESWEDPK